MTTRPTLTGLLLAAGITLALPAQAALHDRGGGLIYDDVLNITWLGDANYAKTSGYDADGRMTWSQAVTWAANLSFYDSVRGVTYDDWRLPTVSPINGHAFKYYWSYDGTTDEGYNLSAPGTAYAGSKASEMAYLFYNELGGKAYRDAAGWYQSVYGVTNRGPFQNLAWGAYWSGTEYARYIYDAWYFDTYYGNQDATGKSSYFLAWAVRPGDVAAPIPEPETYAMLLAGLGLLSVVVKRCKKPTSDA